MKPWLELFSSSMLIPTVQFASVRAGITASATLLKLGMVVFCDLLSSVSS